MWRFYKTSTYNDDWDDIDDASCYATPTQSANKVPDTSSATDDRDGVNEWLDAVCVEVDEMYGPWLMRQLDAQRRSGINCDVFVKVGEHTFGAHRTVLASCSSFFRNVLSRGSENQISLNNIDPEVVEDVLRFIYSGEIGLTGANVRQVVTVAKFLQVTSLVDVATSYLIRNLTVSNCVKIFEFASKHKQESVRLAAERMILDYFGQLARTDDFLALSCEHVVALCDSDCLRVAKEEDVYEAIMEWVMFDKQARLECLPKLLAVVRLTQISVNYLNDRIATSKVLMDNNECHNIVEEARLAQLLPASKSRSLLKQQRPRKYIGVMKGIVLIGGWMSELPTNQSFFLSEGQSQWNRVVSLPEAIYGAVVVCCCRDLYVIGGRSAACALLDSVHRYEFASGRWHARSSLPEPLAASSAVLLDGDIVLVGGFSAHGSVDFVYKYRALQDTWEMLSRTRESRAGSAITTDGSRVYIIGGLTKSVGDKVPTWKFLRSVEKYDSVLQGWTPLGAMSEPRAHACAAFFNHRLYVIGGQSGFCSMAKGVEIYDIICGEWKLLADSGVPRYLSAYAADSGRIYVFGGISQNGALLESVDVFDTAKLTWASTPRLPFPAASTTACPILVDLSVTRDFLGELVSNVERSYRLLSSSLVSS